MAYSAEQLLKKAEQAFSDRDKNRSIYDDCYELLSPHRNTLSKQGGTLNTPTRQYDSTGQISAANFVNTLQREFTPPFTRWSKLEAGPGVPEEQRQNLNETLEKITDQVFSYLNASNFSTASAEMYWEWGIGTGTMWLHEGDQESPFNFIATPTSQMGLCEGKFGTIDARFRRQNLRASLIEPTWPKAKLPDGLKQNIARKKDDEVSVTECFYYDYEKLIWCYEVIVDEGKHTILKSEHLEEICFTPRWMKIPGHAWGVGPFVQGLADIKTLNVLKEFLLRGAALDIAGVYTIANDGGLNPNNVVIAPNTFIPVERNAGENGPTISRLDTGGNFQLQEFMANSLQDQIRKTLLDNRLPAETPQPKTAFEIAQRMKEFQVDIGSAYGRAMLEYIIPMWKRMLGILVRKGLIDLPDGFTVDNLFIQVTVTSPIAQIQKMEDLNKFMQGFQMVQSINPELALMAYDVESLPRWVNEMVGAPASRVRSEAEQSQLQQIVAQMIMQQQAAAAQPTQ
jgi:Bacteriophage head to tail connecting protein